MIVIKDKDTVYFAYAMGHYHNYSTMRFDFSPKDNMSLWHLNDGKGTIVMLDARDRIVDLLRYSDIFNCELTVEALCGVRKQIADLYQGTNCRELDGDTGATIFIARGNQAFQIYEGGSVEELEGVACGYRYRNALLAAYEHCKEIEDPYERIATTYDMVERITSRCTKSVAVINTKDDKMTILSSDK